MIYGLIGQSVETIVFSKSYSPGEGEILMDGARPSPDHVAAISGSWILPTPTPEEARSAKIAAINAERDSRINAGVMFNGARFDSDDKAQIRVTGAVTQMSLAASAGITPPPVSWVAMDDSVAALDLMGLAGLGAAISAHLSACVLAANAHKTAISAMADAAEIDAYDISDGWPA